MKQGIVQALTELNWWKKDLIFGLSQKDKSETTSCVKKLRVMNMDKINLFGNFGEIEMKLPAPKNPLKKFLQNPQNFCKEFSSAFLF